MLVTRLRQVVVAAADLAATVSFLQSAFALGDAFADVGVAEFGLVNGVLPVGDQFVEVVSPVRAHTAAGRWMERAGGDAGYMVIFQVESISDARTHLAEANLRSVWSGDLSEISGTHVHPADIGGAIVSFDEARPPQSWHWAGPSWQDHVRRDTVSGIAGITMAALDPSAMAASWARALNVVPHDRSIVLPDHSRISFVSSETTLARGRAGLVAIDVAASDRSAVGQSTEIAGTIFRLV